MKKEVSYRELLKQILKQENDREKQSDKEQFEKIKNEYKKPLK